MAKLQIDVFAGFNEVDAAEIKVLHEVGARRVIIGLDDEDNGDATDNYRESWRRRAALTRGRLEASLDRLCAEGFEVGVHYWLRPSRVWEDEAAGHILGLAQIYPGMTVLADIERYALQLDPARGGYRDWSDFALWWNARWSAPPADGEHPWWPRVGLAVYAYPNPRSIALAACTCVEEIIPMAYGDARHWKGDPRVLQRESVKRWRQHLRPDQRLTLGLGAYDQARSDREEGAVMMTSAQAVANAGVGRVAYWQLESFDGNNWNHAARRAAIKAAGQMEVA